MTEPAARPGASVNIVLRVARLLPDIHRELHRVNVLGDVTPKGIVQPRGAKVSAPTADFWYLRDGKIERFDCYIMLTTMRAQMGVS